MRCNELRGLFDMLPFGVALTKLALVKGGGTHTRIIEYLRPWMDLVQVASCGLLIDELKVLTKNGFLCAFRGEFDFAEIPRT